MSANNVNSELERGPVGMGIRKVSQDISYGDFTDKDTYGSLTMTDKIPAGSFVIGSKVTVKTGFTGDGVTCALKIGDSGDDNCYSGATTHAIVDAATNLVIAAVIHSNTNSSDDIGLVAEASEVTVLLVATGADTDWSDVSAGEMTVEVFYLSTNLELPVKEEA